MTHPPEYEYRILNTTTGDSLCVANHHDAIRKASMLRRGRPDCGFTIERRLAAPWHPVSSPDTAPLGDARVAVFDVTVTPPNTYSDQGSIGIDVTYRGIVGVTEVPHRGSAARVHVNLDDPISDPF